MAVGKIREQLKQKGLDKNTIIIYHADNGLLYGEHGLSAKWLMYEPSIKVPLIIYDPRVPVKERGVRKSKMTASIDVGPTILDYAGVKAPQYDHMDGMSLLPLLESKQPAWREDLFYEYHFSPYPAFEYSDKTYNPIQDPYGKNAKTKVPKLWIAKSVGVRTERWKYIKYYEQDPVIEQLFDLKNDPGEFNNLALSKDSKIDKVMEDMKKRCEKYNKK